MTREGRRLSILCSEGEVEAHGEWDRREELIALA